MGCDNNAIDELAVQYVREIAVVLRTRDLGKLKRFYHRWEGAMELGPIPDDRRLEIDMHKMILELPALQDLHAESMAWLEANGEVWHMRGNNCSWGCDPGACGRNRPGDDAARRNTGEA
jgi:hypothetical protein